ncbi:asparaginase [Herbiconiux sp. L3-i23]|uniref:asparaginase n=1 Tax=Herbiconiux sp. L3-i23 TaxID=2905871 RepID=UPI00205A455D|nr:asparaginase [Herbiconiux sp. L3-i23]BDI22038.1 asparaginase [Herbiconiux sp. L3-i23]
MSAATPQRGTFAAADAVELAVVERGGFVESRHIGSAVVISADGDVIRELGDPRSPVFPRSTLKPFQALAAIASGAQLTPEETVLATASHQGTVEQARIVRGILAKGRLRISALKCPPAWPDDREARDELVLGGHGPLPIFMECSGKHAAMLLATAVSGWDRATYLDAEHPLQERVREVIQRMTGEHISAASVDGCGLPVYAVSLQGLAAGYARIRTTTHDSPWPLYRDAATLTDAVLAHPHLISGVGQPDAVLIEELGALAKVGAEGLLVAALPDGTTAAVKVLDGSLRPAAAVVVELLASVGAIDGPALARVRARLDLAVLGGGQPVGEIRVTAV